MKWKTYIRKNGSTFYISLPPAYVKAHRIDKEDLMELDLNPDGSLTIRRAEDES